MHPPSFIRALDWQLQQIGIVTTAADTQQKDALQQHADIRREIPKIPCSFSPLAQVHQPLQPGSLILFILMDEDDWVSYQC